MKLKNVVVGSDIEAKHDTKFFKKGDLVKVVAKEDDDYFGEMTLNIMDSDGDTLWVNHKDFRRPRLKTLDQSIFDGVDSRYSYFAIDEDGRGGFYDQKPELCGDCFTSGYGWQPVGYYDATDWKSSLIERESKELTGSELCKAMLERGDKCVLIRMGERDDKQAKEIGRFAIATSIDESGRFNVMSDQQPISKVDFAVPINNQGEPLTAKDVGL